MEICLWAQSSRLKYDALSRKFIVSLRKLKHDKTNIYTNTNIRTTSEKYTLSNHIKEIPVATIVALTTILLLFTSSIVAKPLSAHRAGGVPGKGEQ